MYSKTEKSTKVNLNEAHGKSMNDDDFFDFNEEILKDLISQGYEGQQLLTEFKKTKKRYLKHLIS